MASPLATTTQEDSDVKDTKPEWHTLLLNELADPNTLTPSLAELISGPIDLSSSSSSSSSSSESRSRHYTPYTPRHWVHRHHPSEPVVLRFPAVLHVGGEYGRTEPYFNHRKEKTKKNKEKTEKNNETPIAVKKMKDMRANFELVGMWEHDCVPVKNGGRSRMEPSPVKKEPRVDPSLLLKSTNAAAHYSYPEEALKCSKGAFDYLDSIMQRWESECNPGLDESETNPTQRAFFRPYHNSGGMVVRKVFYVTSYKFFVDVEDASTVDVDFDLEVDFDKLTQQLHSGKKKKQKSDINEAFTLNGLLDPDRRYKTWKNAGHGSTKLNAPQVFDKDGVFIHPNEYKDKLKDGIPVIVDVEPRVWHIQSKKSNKEGGASPDKQTSEEANDYRKLPRTYELKLKSMKLLTSESLGSITPVIVPTPQNSPYTSTIWLRSPMSAAASTSGGGGGRTLKRERPGSPTPTGPRVKRAK